jgi:peroxiredoxin
MDPIISIGEQAPHFQLYDLQGHVHRLEDMNGWIRVLYFWSAECDWCQRVDQELVPYLETWEDRVKIWLIASNANEQQGLIKQVEGNMTIPIILIDDKQVVVDLYGAQTTPHFFVVDQEGFLRYQGAWDDITFRQRKATQMYVPMVVDALINGQTPTITTTQPYGCALLRFQDLSSS